jgi:hypothetical protein
VAASLVQTPAGAEPVAVVASPANGVASSWSPVILRFRLPRFLCSTHPLRRQAEACRHLPQLALGEDNVRPAAVGSATSPEATGGLPLPLRHAVGEDTRSASGGGTIRSFFPLDTERPANQLPSRSLPPYPRLPAAVPSPLRGDQSHPGSSAAKTRRAQKGRPSERTCGGTNRKTFISPYLQFVVLY